MIATAATGSLSRTVGMMAGLMGSQSQLGAPSQRPHPKERPLIKAQLDSAKYLKQMSGAFLGKAGLSFSMGAMLRQSTIMNTTMGTIAQLQGHATDIILAPLMPMIASSLGYIVNDFLPGLQNFIDDPSAWLDEMWTNFMKKNEAASKGKPGTGAGSGTGHFGFENIPTHDVTGAAISARTFGDDVMAGEFADTLRTVAQKALVSDSLAQATADRLAQESLAAQRIVAQETLASHNRNAEAYLAASIRDGGIVGSRSSAQYAIGAASAAAQRERDLQIQQDASMMVDFEYQQAYEMNKAMTTFNKNRQEIHEDLYAQDDMVGFY